ncbi:unnamed protein product [Enterobius vermicularis]|uniref:ZZ-type domain-containing protein n=1 Tax=Enterobius vermicularis TaxID=51028 RepID=A0A0N4UWH2_ENTVE|nr:unnamed protein product [Enterobius vermicularis]
MTLLTEFVNKKNLLLFPYGNWVAESSSIVGCMGRRLQCSVGLKWAICIGCNAYYSLCAGCLKLYYEKFPKVAFERYLKMAMFVITVRFFILKRSLKVSLNSAQPELAMDLWVSREDRTTKSGMALRSLPRKDYVMSARKKRRTSIYDRKNDDGTKTRSVKPVSKSRETAQKSKISTHSTPLKRADFRTFDSSFKRCPLSRDATPERAEIIKSKESIQNTNKPISFLKITSKMYKASESDDGDTEQNNVHVYVPVTTSEGETVIRSDSKQIAIRTISSRYLLFNFFNGIFISFLGGCSRLFTKLSNVLPRFWDRNFPDISARNPV